MLSLHRYNSAAINEWEKPRSFILMRVGCVSVRWYQNLQYSMPDGFTACMAFVCLSNKFYVPKKCDACMPFLSCSTPKGSSFHSQCVLFYSENRAKWCLIPLPSRPFLQLLHYGREINDCVTSYCSFLWRQHPIIESQCACDQMRVQYVEKAYLIQYVPTAESSRSRLIKCTRLLSADDATSSNLATLWLSGNDVDSCGITSKVVPSVDVNLRFIQSSCLPKFGAWNKLFRYFKMSGRTCKHLRRSDFRFAKEIKKKRALVFHNQAKMKGNDPALGGQAKPQKKKTFSRIWKYWAQLLPSPKTSQKQGILKASNRVTWEFSMHKMMPRKRQWDLKRCLCTCHLAWEVVWAT